MAVADSAGLPISVHIASASPHEVTLVEETVAKCFVPDEKPDRLIGDKAYDSDPLDVKLAIDYGVELIAPHRSVWRKRPNTQDGRPLRRHRRRWKVERLFAWLQNFRRILVRYEYYAENFLGFVQLGCMLILLRRGVYEMSSSEYTGIDDFPGEYWMLHHILPDAIMYVPSYLFAAVRAAELDRHLQNKFGDMWWNEKDVGKYLREIMHPGTKIDLRRFSSLDRRIFVKEITGDA